MNKSKRYNIYHGDSYTQRADKAITQVALFLPIILIFYAALVRINVISSQVRISNLWFMIIMVALFVFGVMQYIKPGKTVVTSAIKLVEFHLISAIYLLFIVGFNSPIVIFYPILIIASYTFFDKSGIIFSILILSIIVCINIIAWHLYDLTLILNDVTTFITILLTGIFVVIISKTHEANRLELIQSKIRESLQRDRVAAIVNNLTDAILSTDSKGVIKVYNASSLNLLDTNINLIGHNINNILNLIDSNNKKVKISELLYKSKSVVQRDDLSFVFNNNEKIRLALTYTPIRRGFSNSRQSELHDGYIVILRDITKEKSLEEERDDFISVVSHELRTPITTAEASVSNLKFMIKLPNTTLGILEEPIDIAHEQIMFLANLVNDLSTLSRAERGVGGDSEEIDVKELTDSLIKKYIDDANKKNLKLTSNISTKVKTIRVSRLYIDELLQNLVSNAVKYTKKGSVTLNINKDDNNIIFSVTDTGIGISKSDQDKIFGKFYRSEDYRTRETGGTGLGLYVAQQLAAKLGSKIELESELNVGSTFSFKINNENN